MGEIAKYGGMTLVTTEDMRRRDEDNAKVRAACADQAEDWAHKLLALKDDPAVRAAIGLPLPPLPIYGRMDGEHNPDPRTQAILRHSTTCVICGQRIKAGDEIIITFATAPAEGTFRHADCEVGNG